jgi:O-antigen ligase
MILTITFLFLLLSIFAFVIGKPILSIFLILLASSRSIDGYLIIGSIGVILTLQCIHAYFLKIDKIIWLISILFICYQLAVFIVHPYKIYFSYYFSYINAFLMFFATFFIEWNREKVRNFTLSYIAVLFLCGILEFILINPVRISEPYHFATLYAVVLVSVWTIWLSDSIITNDYFKAAVVTFFVFLMVLLSGTRMGLLGMALGLSLSGISKILFGNFKKKILIKIFFGIILLMFLSVLIFFVWQIIPEDLLIKRNFESILSMKLDNSNLGRVVAWITAIDIIPKHTLWGVGYGNFNNFVQKLLQESGGYVSFFLPHAHNLFLIVLSEQGVIGFVVIGLIVFLCVYKLFYCALTGSQNNMVYAILNGFIVMMFMGLFDATPLTLGTLCFGGWLMGISAKISTLK